ncbi:MAG: tetratricopeptide repeat protein [Planctomycetota bacterium]
MTRHLILVFCWVWVASASTPVLAQRSRTTKRAKPSTSTLVDPYLSSTRAPSKKLTPWTAKLNRAVSELKSGRRSRAEATLKSLLELDAKNPIARRYLADLQIARGQWEAAEATLGRKSRLRGKQPRDPVPLMNWQILGPFENQGRRKSITEAYEPEAQLAESRGKMDLMASYKGDGRVCRWKKVKGPIVNYRRELSLDDDDAVAYGYCEFLSKRAGWVRIGIGSADGAKVWVNGDALVSKPGRRDIQEDDDKVWAWLPKGKNYITIKVESDGGAFSHYVQIYDEIVVPRSELLSSVIAGEKALKAGKLREAQKYLLAAEGAEPGHPDVAVGLAEIALREGNYTGARSWVTRALLERPGKVRGLTIYAETELAMRQPLRAFDALRAAYLASDYADEKVFDLWRNSAKSYEATFAKIQTGLAHLDRARGLRKRKDRGGAQKDLESAKKLLGGTFVGLADLSNYYREEGDRKNAGKTGLAAVETLSSEQVHHHCSTDWLLRLADDLKKAGAVDAASRKKVLALLQDVDPNHPSYVTQLIAALPPGQRRGMIGRYHKIEKLLRANPQKDTYKAYADYLQREKLHRKVVTICREGLAAGIVSRKLRYWMGHSLIALKRLDEAEQVFRDLLKERDYVKRAKEGLELVRKAAGDS